MVLRTTPLRTGRRLLAGAISSHDRDNAATGVTKQLQPGSPAKLGLILPKTAMPVIPLIGTLGPGKRGHDRILPSGLRAAARPCKVRAAGVAAGSRR